MSTELKTLNGYGFDATKLGGLDAQYYAQGRAAHNLLDNSDFTNPINYRGLSSYTGQAYGIDRWYGRSVAQTVEVRSTDVTVTATGTSYVGIMQKVGNFEKLAGKTVTLAARVYANVVPQILFVDGSGNVLAEKNGTAGSEQTLVLSYTLPTNTASENVIPTIRILTSASGDYIRLYWAALYEGSYTVDTVPTYVPKDRIVEMICCGVPLHQRNLLDNSDFRIKNNIINTKGLTDYSFDSGNVFDRWRLHWTGDGRVSIKDGYIELYRETHCTYLFQHPRDLQSMVGKTYTVAAKVRYNGRIGWIDSTQRVDCGPLAFNDWDIATCTFTVGSATSDIGEAGIEIASRSNLSFEVQWVALYEGAYTKETLPAYLTKGKHVEMLNCGVQLNPRNLLDNSWWRNPKEIINQRGETSKQGDWIYWIDRWLINAPNAPVELRDGGIYLPATVDANVRILQRIPVETIDNGKVYTLAICESNGTIRCVSGVYNNNRIGGDVIGNGFVYLSMQPGGETYVYFIIDCYKNFTIRWAALYEGSYTADTLPACQPKGYAAELAECMRYYLPLNNQLLGSGYTFSDGAALLVPRKMRIDAPSFVASGTIRARVNGADYPLTLSSVTTYGSMIKVDFACDNIPMNYPCAFYSEASSVSLNADL